MKWLSQISFAVLCLVVIVPALAGKTPATRPATTQAAGGDDARTLMAKSNLSTIKMALDAYEIDNGAYPSTSEGLRALVEKPKGEHKDWHGPYIEKLINDPWGNDYVYRSPGKGDKQYDLLSCGPDGKEGGGDDITN